MISDTQRRRNRCFLSSDFSLFFQHFKPADTKRSKTTSIIVVSIVQTQPYQGHKNPQSSAAAVQNNFLEQSLNVLLIFSAKQSSADIIHCVKSVQIRSIFWFVFSCIRTEFGLNYSVRIQEIRTRKNSVFCTPGFNSFLFLHCIYN